MSRVFDFDLLKATIEATTGGTNTVILDDVGMPSIMVAIPKMYSNDLISGAAATIHPAFVVDGVEKNAIYVSKYLNIVVNNRAYSLPMQDPAVNINADTARTNCRNKGNGWGLMPNSLWAAVALWSKKNGTMPHGNNQYGKDVTYTHEYGVETSYEAVSGGGKKTCRTATGSGAATWYHDHTKSGIADLNGNVWEWCDAMRLKNGGIQVVPYSNSLLSSTDMSENSTEWKSIDTNGQFVDSGAAGSLKLDFIDSKWTISTSLTSQSSSNRSSTFQSMAAESGLTVPQIIKELALYPADADGYEGDNVWATNDDTERFPLRGGRWLSGADAGVFALYLYHPRSDSDSTIGFRSAYVSL